MHATVSILLGAYIAGINISVFCLCALDKRRAQRGAWRVSERTFWILALLGGSPGLLLGMQLFRHKTRKASFHLVLGIILLFQLWLLRAVLGTAN